MADTFHRLSLGPTRRALLAAAASIAIVAAVGALLPMPVVAQKPKGPSEVPVEELMKPGELPELALGPADAKVVVVEYASMTCGHCANFHNKTFPDLKKKYIDTGKVRFIMREFPLDHNAAAATIQQRCAAADKEYPMIE